MRVLMLGTGAADGWPTPWCRCESCESQRDHGLLRGPSSALIDDVLLVDSGPEAPRAAVRAGATLAAVRTLLLTHEHPDHLHPQVLLWRRWAHVGSTLTVAGPPAALAACAEWIGPDDPVRTVALAPGDRLDVGSHRILALPASHTEGSLLYVIEGADGSRLLYATDTGPLSAEAWRMLEGTRFDAVLLELTWGERTDHDTDHHDLSTWPVTLRTMRHRGLVDADTDVMAFHLGHGNPPEPRLREVLRAWGARPVRDAQAFLVGPGTLATDPRQRTLVTGGARSGKSHHAEMLVAADTQVRYLATASAMPDDTEWNERVARHRARRPDDWSTIETLDIAAELRRAGAGTTVLVDCLTLWLTGIIDAADGWTDPHAATVEPAIDELLQALTTTSARVVLVTNETGSGIVPDTASGRVFRDLLGMLNRRVAASCDEVVHTVAGQAVRIR